MRFILAILIGKLAGGLSRLLGGKGSTIPGVIAKKIAPNILVHLSQKIPDIVLVSGTNGKTTTNNLISVILSKAGKRVLCNCEGANMLSGIIATFVNSSSLTGKLSYDYAVIEVDEGSIPGVLEQIKPNKMIFTNFFRDQLDRFEEVDLLITHIKGALQKKKIQLILNADDPFVVQLAGYGSDQPIYYGINKFNYQMINHFNGESKYCPQCDKELQYDAIHYGQLGIFHCTCGYNRPIPKYGVTNINGDNELNFSINEEVYHIKLQGVYNIYNALAAISYIKEEGIGYKNIRQGVLEYIPCNGRMQQFNKEGVEWVLNLVKNPAGFNLSLSETLRVKGAKQLVFLLNDLDADGNDISWIWDVDFGQVKHADFQKYICSGRRANDMALRLKYEGIDEEKVVIESDALQALKEASKTSLTTFLFPTYTMLKETQRGLSKII